MTYFVGVAPGREAYFLDNSGADMPRNAFLSCSLGAVEFNELERIDCEQLRVRFTCRLTHLGNSTLWDQDRVLMTFSHKLRATILNL